MESTGLGPVLSAHTTMFNPGADAFSEGVNVAYHELGHANPAALDDNTISIGRITSGCPELGRPRLLVRGGTSPSWGRGEPALERQALAALAAGPALLSLTVGFGDADLADEGARGPRSGPTHACRFR